jgi:hypothetical protein
LLALEKRSPVTEGKPLGLFLKSAPYGSVISAATRGYDIKMRAGLHGLDDYADRSARIASWTSSAADEWRWSAAASPPCRPPHCCTRPVPMSRSLTAARKSPGKRKRREARAGRLHQAAAEHPVRRHDRVTLPRQRPAAREQERSKPGVRGHEKSVPACGQSTSAETFRRTRSCPLGVAHGPGQAVVRLLRRPGGMRRGRLRQRPPHVLHGQFLQRNRPDDS